MKTSRAASRYGKALLDMAIERKELEKIKDDVVEAKATIEASRELRLFLASPVVKPKIKQKILTEIFSINSHPSIISSSISVSSTR